MDIFESEIPDIRIRNYGKILKPLEVIETRTVLDAWNGYFLQHRENGREITDGKVRLDFGGCDGEKSRNWQPEINAYRHLLKNQYEIRDNILKSLTEKVGELTQYLDPNDSFVPNITHDANADFDFRPFIGPLSISFDGEEIKDDLLYLEWHFQCAWDLEHGFAVTTHGTRVIDLDQETDPFKIYEDNGTLAEKQREYEKLKNYKPQVQQKPWWQFW